MISKKIIKNTLASFYNILNKPTYGKLYKKIWEIDRPYNKGLSLEEFRKQYNVFVRSDKTPFGMVLKKIHDFHCAIENSMGDGSVLALYAGAVTFLGFYIKPTSLIKLGSIIPAIKFLDILDDARDDHGVYSMGAKHKIVCSELRNFFNFCGQYANDKSKFLDNVKKLLTHEQFIDKNIPKLMIMLGLKKSELVTLADEIENNNSLTKNAEEYINLLKTERREEQIQLGLMTLEKNSKSPLLFSNGKKIKTDLPKQLTKLISAYDQGEKKDDPYKPLRAKQN